MSELLKSKFHRQNRTISSRLSQHSEQPSETSPLLSRTPLLQSRAPPRQEPDPNAAFTSNETRDLSGAAAAFHRPSWKDRRWWIRWPALLWHVTGHRIIPKKIAYSYRPASYRWLRWTNRVSRFIGPVWGPTWRILTSNYLNLLFLFLPLLLMAYELALAPEVVFAFGFLAIIPLSGLVQTASEDLSASLPYVPGHLLIAFSDNAVELVIGAVGLTYGEVALVQQSMLGSALCYSILIMGSCFLANGIRYSQGIMNRDLTKTIASLNYIALGLLGTTMVPFAFREDNEANYIPAELISRAIAILLIALYLAYLNFMLWTHSNLFDDEDDDDIANNEDPSMEYDIYFGPYGASCWLVLSLALISLCASALISSIDHLSWNISKTFIGFIIFPFLANVPDYVSAWNVASKNELNITIQVTLGSCMQILLFTMPTLVLLGWILQVDLAFNFSVFLYALLFLGVTIINTIVQSGRTHWLLGALCISLYAIIALAVFCGGDDDGQLSSAVSASLIDGHFDF